VKEKTKGFFDLHQPCCAGTFISNANRDVFISSSHLHECTKLWKM